MQNKVKNNLKAIWDTNVVSMTKTDSIVITTNNPLTKFQEILLNEVLRTLNINQSSLEASVHIFQCKTR